MNDYFDETRHYSVRKIIDRIIDEKFIQWMTTLPKLGPLKAKVGT